MKATTRSVACLVLLVAIVAACRREGRPTDSLPRCEPVGALMRRLPGLVVSVGVTTLDSAWSGAGERPACRLVASGHFVGGYASMDSLFAWLRGAGWRDNTAYSADGPDGMAAGTHRAGVTCIIEGHWDGGDDAASTTVPGDTLDIFATCAATLPADTTLP